jgi:hypothetical protein
MKLLYFFTTIICCSESFILTNFQSLRIKGMPKSASLLQAANVKRMPVTPFCSLQITVPQSIAEMMRDAGHSVSEGLSSDFKLMAVEVPLPITGGTELDDWPGGIGQKYMALRPMASEMMKAMNFSSDVISTKNFMGIVDDAIGIWTSENVAVVCFATPEVLGLLKSMREDGTSIVLLNHQFFLDSFSSSESKQFIESATVVYQLQSLNMKGGGLLPIKGVLKRQYPAPFIAARKLDQGQYVELGRYDAKPARSDLDKLFLKDSEERDKSLSLWDRLKRIRDEASKI